MAGDEADTLPITPSSARASPGAIPSAAWISLSMDRGRGKGRARSDDATAAAAGEVRGIGTAEVSPAGGDWQRRGARGTEYVVAGGGAGRSDGAEETRVRMFDTYESEEQKKRRRGTMEGPLSSAALLATMPLECKPPLKPAHSMAQRSSSMHEKAPSLESRRSSAGQIDTNTWLAVKQPTLKRW